LRSRSIAVRAILNLSWAPENKTPFSEHVNLIHALIETCFHRTSSWGGNGRGVSGILLQSRRHAAGALRNLAAAPRRNKKYLCGLNSGKFLRDLADIAHNDPDYSVRSRIYATFHNLVCVDTAEIIISSKEVMDILEEVASPINSASEKEKKNLQNLRSSAILTLRTLEKATSEDMEVYKTLKGVIDRIEGRVESKQNRAK